jgi:hypothetical protein
LTERQDVVKVVPTTEIEGLSQSPDQQEEPKMQWTGRVVTDTRGDAGAVVLDDESTARVEVAAECLYAAAYEN